jgi:hypothetical protein
MDNKDKTDAILKKTKEQINNLILSKITGKIALTIEVNMNQGAIGSASIGKKENISFTEIIS